MHKITLAVLVTAVTALVVAGTSGAGVAAPITGPTTIEAIGALPMAEQTIIMTPLRTAANALGDVGRGPGADIYAGLRINAPQRTVDLYLTDLTRAAGFLGTAGAGKVDLSMVKVHPATYTRTQLEAARDRIAASRAMLPLPVAEATVPPDGSGLVLGIAQKASADNTFGTAIARDAVSSAAGVPVTYTHGGVFEGDDRMADTPPFYAGAAISDDIYNYGPCSSGVPVKNASGHQYILTASHCGHLETHWKTPAADLGWVVEYYEPLDVSVIDAESAAWEWDCPPGPCSNRIQLSGTAWTYNGDLVCQDGQATGVACSLFVDNDNVMGFTVHGSRYGNYFAVRGVKTHKTDGGIAAQPGDSGALVFTINSGGTTRQVRGLVSANIDGMGLNGMFFSEANRIYSFYNLHLTDRYY